MTRVIFSILMFLAPSACFGWSVTSNFENGTVGSVANGTSGFGGAGSATTYSSSNAKTGSQSAKMTWPHGSDGWGVVHGTFAYPSIIIDGGEIWARGYFYFASPWSWACSPVVKVLRAAHVSTSSSTNVGYHSVFANSEGYILASNEVADSQPSTGVKFDIDAWQSIEMYVKLSSTDPTVRIWKNGTLIYEDKTRITIRNTTDRGDLTYIMTYWNGGAPQVQTQYVDDFVLTTDIPSGRDAAGNPMIGPLQYTRHRIKSIVNQGE